MEGNMDMSNATTRSGSLNGRLGLVALLASMCLIAVALFGASSAKASTIGDPVDVDFNYAGIDVTASLGGLSDLVLKDGDGLGVVQMRGTYTSTDGDFVVPKVGGLSFPNISVDLGVALDAQIGLEEDATGNYNSATGVMTMNPKISLTLGVDDLGALLGGSLGTGPLGCKVAPLDIDLSTGGGWPAAGNTFDAGSPIKNGALAGAWTVKPDLVATQGAQATCDLIGSLLEPVGGLWLAQSDTVVSALPAATSAKPAPAVCEEGFEGTPPNCTEIPVVLTPAKVAVQGKPRAVTIKRGRSGVVKVTVRNSGQKSATGVKVCGRISAKVAKAPRCVTLGTIAAGKSKTASLKLSTTRRSKGSGRLSISITSAVGGKASTSATVKIKK
jgi:hypothetical protein